LHKEVDRRASFERKDLLLVDQGKNA